ncbi:MAG TPA: PPC domain-containing DNA-binding protein [Roseiarcus sp.]|nr:PPC domain-containing DNA-binding protein [Roseiarcus sp.]
MKSKLVAGVDGRSFVLALDPGEEAFAAITKFAQAEGLPGASLTAIGAFERATVGWFDIAKKEYRKIEIAEQCEALSLVGDVAIDDGGAPSLHLHAVLGLSDGSTRGGHLLEAIVQPTLEVMIRETPKGFRRKKRPDLGLALIDLSQ